MFSHPTDAGGQQLIVELEMSASSKVDAQALAKSYQQGLGSNQATVSYTESTGRILLYRWSEGAIIACSSKMPCRVRCSIQAGLKPHVMQLTSAIVPAERKTVVESEMPNVGVRISACYVSGAQYAPHAHCVYRSRNVDASHQAV